MRWLVITMTSVTDGNEEDVNTAQLINTLPTVNFAGLSLLYPSFQACLYVCQKDVELGASKPSIKIVIPNAM